jgi:hypothetical protein
MISDTSPPRKDADIRDNDCLAPVIVDFDCKCVSGSGTTIDNPRWPWPGPLVSVDARAAIGDIPGTGK